MAEGDRSGRSGGLDGHHPGELPAATAARFVEVPIGAGHYESYYLKATAPQGGLGIWIRYTVHKAPGAAPKSYLWLTLFDAGVGVSATKVQGPPPQAGSEGDYIRIGAARFGPGRIVGAAESAPLVAAWDISFDGEEAPVFHLPYGWMYRASFPRTKVCSPHPAISLHGTVSAGERTIDLEGWSGTIGHNWGAEHARRAIWIHGAGFGDRKGTWLDLAIGRIGLGPLTSPWIANGVLCLEGRRHRLGGLQRVHSTRIHERPERCHFALRGDDILLEGEVGADRRSFVSWLYAQPRGGERQTVNCSIADMRLQVRRAGEPPLVLESAGSAAYELQMSERCPAIAPQPFPDG